jgi:hypothetical protein
MGAVPKPMEPGAMRPFSDHGGYAAPLTVLRVHGGSSIIKPYLLVLLHVKHRTALDAWARGVRLVTRERASWVPFHSRV